jgi:two-component system, chemotaxis family, chemotaxis protein CheY
MAVATVGIARINMSLFATTIVGQRRGQTEVSHFERYLCARLDINRAGLLLAHFGARLVLRSQRQHGGDIGDLMVSVGKTAVTPIRALVADDSVFIRDLIRRHLERIGCQVVAEAENASQALTLFRSLRPDFVTLDIVMAEADGIDTLAAFRAIRKEAPRVPIVIVTAVPFDESRDTFMKNGALDYVVKPFNIGSFEQIRRKLAAIFPGLKSHIHDKRAAAHH